MTLLVAVGIRQENKDFIRPGPALLVRAGQVLLQHGFQLSKLGRFSVTVKATPEQVAAVFGIPLSEQRPTVFAAVCADSELEALVTTIEILPPR